VDDDNLRFGMRGRVSYRGDGRYRNDWVCSPIIAWGSATRTT